MAPIAVPGRRKLMIEEIITAARSPWQNAYMEILMIGEIWDFRKERGFAIATRQQWP